ncbi:hypothetical protein D3C83_38530 [compost metagenome]
MPSAQRRPAQGLRARAGFPVRRSEYRGIEMGRRLLASCCAVEPIQPGIATRAFRLAALVAFVQRHSRIPCLNRFIA